FGGHNKTGWDWQPLLDKLPKISALAADNGLLISANVAEANDPNHRFNT
ncbi:MAG: hypothetical protein ACI809_002363, partial [Candidatus Azotimanducaceae bacterium]